MDLNKVWLCDDRESWYENKGHNEKPHRCALRHLPDHVLYDMFMLKNEWCFALLLSISIWGERTSILCTKEMEVKWVYASPLTLQIIIRRWIQVGCRRAFILRGWNSIECTSIKIECSSIKMSIVRNNECTMKLWKSIKKLKTHGLAKYGISISVYATLWTFHLAKLYKVSMQVLQYQCCELVNWYSWKVHGSKQKQECSMPRRHIRK